LRPAWKTPSPPTPRNSSNQIFISSMPTPAASASPNPSFERTVSSCKKPANSFPPVSANRAAPPAWAPPAISPRAQKKPPSPSSTLELLSRTRDESLSRKTRAALEDPEKWLFLDTETTGLAGGTGTYAFLIGLAWWDAGGLQVEQFFMRDFAKEHSLLHELSHRIAERPVLVTFNGKSFDWPLLENRFTMTRSIAVPKLAAHLDLLHPARALWKLRLGSVRL